MGHLSDFYHTFVQKVQDICPLIVFLECQAGTTAIREKLRIKKEPAQRFSLGWAVGFLCEALSVLQEHSNIYTGKWRGQFDWPAGQNEDPVDCHGWNIISGAFHFCVNGAFHQREAVRGVVPSRLLFVLWTFQMQRCNSPRKGKTNSATFHFHGTKMNTEKEGQSCALLQEVTVGKVGRPVSG